MATMPPATNGTIWIIPTNANFRRSLGDKFESGRFSFREINNSWDIAEQRRLPSDTVTNASNT